jgi:hypothetical protein
MELLLARRSNCLMANASFAKPFRFHDKLERETRE